MSRRYPKRPGDYVRCAGCGRLVEKVNVSTINGLNYGRECRTKGLDAARTDPLAEARAALAEREAEDGTENPKK